MALSIDALLAVVLFVALVAFTSTEPISEMPVTQSTTAANQLVDDAISAMDNTGFIMQSIENAQPELISGQLDGLLPSNVGYRLEMTKYFSPVDEPGDMCRTNRDFTTCFPEDGEVFYVTNLNVPEDREVYHGRKIFVKKEPGDCGLEEDWLEQMDKELTAMLLGNYAPEVRDVNITTSASCDANTNPCPKADQTMRCCYEYYDADGDDEDLPAEFTWYKYDSEAGGDKWVVQEGEEEQTVSGMNEDERWKCSVRVSDGSEWSEDANSAFAIVGGPCFQFSAEMSPEPITCGTASSVDFSVSGQSGGRKDPVDIVLTLDSSGSMSWNGRYDRSAESVFIEAGAGIDTAYIGTSADVNKVDVNNLTGEIIANYVSPTLDYAYGVYVDGSYVFVADNDNGLTILDKSDMSLVRTIGEAGASKEITTGRGVYVSGGYAYMAAAGTYVEGEEKKYGAQMSSDRTEDDERIGYNSSQSWMAQEFVPGVSDINGVMVEMRKYGSPNDLTMHIRSSLTGADLPNGTVTVSSGDISTDWDTWLDIPITNGSVSVNPNDTYYLVFTTTSQSTSNYYRWGSREGSSNPYSDGRLFRCTSGGRCEEQEGGSWWNKYYEDSRFRIYTYASIVGGLVVVNVSDADPENWSIVSNIYDTGSGRIDQPQDVFVSGSYAYLVDNGADDGDAEGLWIIDISDPGNPAFEGFVATSNAYGVDVDVLEKYAYVTDQGGNFYIIDVQDKANPDINVTFSDLGNVEDIYVDGTTAYVSANDVGSGATSTGIHVIDVSDPPNAAKTETFYSPYSSFGRLSVGTEFILVTNSTLGLISLNKVHGPKINSARDSATEFVNYDEWTAPEDHLGLVSYASEVNHRSELLEATSGNKTTINSRISEIESIGGTDMNSGLWNAYHELDANGTEDAIQFVILLADGQNDGDDMDLTIAKLNSSGIYAFTIGFGGDVDEDELQKIASCAYCPDNTEPNCEDYVAGSEADCGSYHHASDPEALSDVYELIAGTIANLSGKMPDSETSGITMVFDSFLQGLELSNFDPAYSSWDGTTLTYEDIDLRTEWVGSFDAYVPCNYEGCGADFNIDANNELLFPPRDTTISYALDEEEQDPVYWPEKYMAGGELYYTDLEIGFVAGTYHGTEDTEVEYQIRNMGYSDIDLSQIDPIITFYKDADNPLEACEEPLDEIGTQLIEWDLNALLGESAGTDTNINMTTGLGGSGYICIWLNKGQSPVVDCSENNRIVIHCDAPETFVYILDYWAWEK